MKENRIKSSIVSLIMLGMMSSGVSHAQSDWEYAGSLNLWGAGIKGATAGGADIDISLGDILDNLDFIFMGTLEGRNSKWSWLTDVVYLDMQADEGGTLPGPLATPVKADVEMEGWVVNLLGGYNLSTTEAGFLDGVFGARYLDIETAVGLDIGGAGAGVSATGDVIDAVIGIRGRANLDGNWYLPYYLDVGTGESEVTWQAIAGAGYKFNWGDISLTYRYMAWEFDDDSALEDIDFSGPLVQFKWYF